MNFSRVRPLLWLVPISVSIGVASAFFLWSLDFVTRLRFQNPHLLFLLPFSGVFLAWVYERLGKLAARGTDAVWEGIRNGSFTPIPARMAPLILAATLWTHLFGGSAGREGTALQMGGAFTATFARIVKTPPSDARLLLLCGVAAGFSGVFGTPLAGAFFAFEAVFGTRFRGEISFARSLLPCLGTAFLAHKTAHFCGAHHADLRIALPVSALFSPLLWLQLVLAGAVFGAAGWVFVRSLALFRGAMNRWIPSPLWRPFWGGSLVMISVFALGTRDYIGLGAWSPHPDSVTILSAFRGDGAEPFSWFWKGVLTIFTLGSGFKGGEVTPLFFIGATLGNSLASVCGAPVSLLAAAGFVGVFAAATKTPLACAILGLELFGAPLAPVFLVVCALAHFCSGRVSIYDVAYLREAARVSRF